MRFDRKAPGGGAEAVCSLENGRAMLEWRLSFTDEPAAAGSVRKREVEGSDVYSDSKASWVVRLLLTDMQGNMVLEGMQSVREEEPLRSVLLQPRLWKGTEDPYLYRLEAVLEDGNGGIRDRISRTLPLRTFSNMGNTGMFSLNGEPFERRAVSYTPPSAASEVELQRLVMEDFQRISRLGANCIYVEGGGELRRLFLHLCDRMGLLLFCREKGEEGYTHPAGGGAEIRTLWKEAVPAFCGEKESLFASGSRMPTSLYYRYLAKWGREPFVYIVPESVKRLGSGNYIVRCYSSCGRIALYSDGVLFEFQRGEGEFTFLEVPARTPCIILTAEGDGCSASLSLSKSICLSSEKNL